MHDTFVQDVFKKNALDNKFPIRHDNDEPIKGPAQSHRPAPPPPRVRTPDTEGWDEDHERIFTQMQSDVASLLKALDLNPSTGKSYLHTLNERIVALQDKHVLVTTNTGKEFDGIKEDLFQTQKAHAVHVQNLNALNGALQNLQQSHNGLIKTHEELNRKVTEKEDAKAAAAAAAPQVGTVMVRTNDSKLRKAKFVKKGVEALPTLYIPIVPPQEYPEHYFRAFILQNNTFEMDKKNYYNNVGNMFNSDPIDQDMMKKIQEVDLYKKYLKTEGAVPLEVSLLPPEDPKPAGTSPEGGGDEESGRIGFFTESRGIIKAFIPVKKSKTSYYVVPFQNHKNGANEGKIMVTNEIEERIATKLELNDNNKQIPDADAILAMQNSAFDDNPIVGDEVNEIVEFAKNGNFFEPEEY